MSGRLGVQSRYVGLVLAALTLVVIAALAWMRGGMLNLPEVPPGLTLESSGLADLQAMRTVDEFIRRGTRMDFAPASSAKDREPELPLGISPAAAMLVRDGLRKVEQGDWAAGLEIMREGIQQEPGNLVLGNAYRMVVFQQRREHVRSSRQSGLLVPEFPPHLAGEPIAFFTELVRRQRTREATLQLALAWVDEMLLFPALEIKAPASVEAVHLLTELLDAGEQGYVPALFARGLNHLHRPARLVWPEAASTPRDAAARDIGLCVAIGRKFDVGSDRLQATLAIALGDAYVKAGRLSLARSWWQLAQNIGHDDDLRDSVQRRFGWSDEAILDRLEAELDHCRTQLDRPMTDLAIMWSSS